MNGKDAESWTVSIHATLAGGDAPRPAMYLAWITFLSTPPSRVATRRYTQIFRRVSGFYPRHPRGWRLRCSVRGAHPPLEFLSTPPSRVATPILLVLAFQLLVSIHATLAGGDK